MIGFRARYCYYVLMDLDTHHVLGYFTAIKHQVRLLPVNIGVFCVTFRLVGALLIWNHTPARLSCCPWLAMASTLLLSQQTAAALSTQWYKTVLSSAWYSTSLTLGIWSVSIRLCEDPNRGEQIFILFFQNRSWKIFGRPVKLSSAVIWVYGRTPSRTCSGGVLLLQVNFVFICQAQSQLHSSSDYLS